MRSRSLRSLGDAEIATAMELRAVGIEWRYIAEGLGCSINGIKKAVGIAEDLGMRPHFEARSRVRSTVINTIAERKLNMGAQ